MHTFILIEKSENFSFQLLYTPIIKWNSSIFISFHFNPKILRSHISSNFDKMHNKSTANLMQLNLLEGAMNFQNSSKKFLIKVPAGTPRFNSRPQRAFYCPLRYYATVSPFSLCSSLPSFVNEIPKLRCYQVRCWAVLAFSHCFYGSILLELLSRLFSRWFPLFREKLISFVVFSASTLRWLNVTYQFLNYRRLMENSTWKDDSFVIRWNIVRIKW